MAKYKRTPEDDAYYDGAATQMSKLPMSYNPHDPVKQPELYEAWCRGYYDSEDDE